MAIQYRQKPYNLILSDICLAINDVLHDTIGIYLHGSLAMNCHNLKKSDIDIVAVVETELQLKAELRVLIERIIDIESKYDVSIEISVVTEDSLNNFKHPSSFVFHYSMFHRERYLNDPDYICGWNIDPDLAAHFYMIQQRGVALYGQQIATLFKGNYEKDYWNSVMEDISSDITDTNDDLVYFTLNYCRTLMYKKNGEVGSKLEGGLWALENSEIEFGRLVKSAIRAYKGEIYEKIDLIEFNKFRDYVLDRLDETDLSKMAKDILLESTNEKREVNEVLNNNYVFTTNDDKEPLMIKFVRKEERNRLEVEIAMFSFINKKTDLIVPKVLDSGENEFYVYIIREMIKGETLEKYQKNNPNDIEELYYEAGRILAQLHSIEFSEKGYFQPDLSIHKYDLFNMNEYLRFIETLYKKSIISNKEFINLKKIDVEHYFSKHKNVLCHCDYNPKNILVREGRIAGVIDYEWVSSAPFMDDLATFDLFAEMFGYGDQTKSFYEGYKTVKSIDDFYFEDIEFYKFYRLVTMLSYQSEASDDRFKGELQQKMKEKLRRYI